MMRVLLLSTQSRSDKTGVRVYCDALERGLGQAGWCSVRRVCHHDAGRGWHHFAVLCLKACRVLGRGAQQVLTRWLVAVQISVVLRKLNGGVDVVLAQDPITGAMAQRAGFRTWAVCHFSDPIEEIFRAVRMGGVARWAMRRTMCWFLRHNARYVVLSETAAKMMRHHVPSARIEIIPTICRYNRFAKSNAHDGFRLVTVGRLEPLKGQRRLIEALSFLCDLPVEVWLVGDGADRRDLETLAQTLGLSGRVRFWGFVEDVASILTQCDLYVHTSAMEAIPLTCIEAVFCGCPAWSFETPGYNDFHVFDGTPHLSQTTAAERLAEAIRGFVGMSERDRLAGLAQQQKRVEMFQLCSVVERYRALLQES